MPLAAKLVAYFVVAVYMLETGLATPVGSLRERVRMGELGRALLLMLVLGPLAARLTVGVLGLPPQPAVALVLLSLVGVVPLATKGAHAAHADVGFAVVLSIALGIVAPLTAEPTTRLLLDYHGPLDVHADKHLLQVLVLELVPLAIGVYVRSKNPGRARALENVLAIFLTGVIALLLVGTVVVLYQHGAVRSLGWTGALAALLFSVFLAGAGYLLARPDERAYRTTAALANMPNVVMAIPIVASAGVAPGFTVALLGVFVLRLAVALAVQRMLGRSRGSTHGHRRPGWDGTFERFAPRSVG